MAPDDVSGYDWLKKAVKKEDWEWLSNEALHEVYRRTAVYDGAQQFVRSLLDVGEVVILTRRPLAVAEDTLFWWYRNRFPSVSGINFFRDGAYKPLVQVDFMVEDDPYCVAAFYQKSPNTTVVLVDRPYNIGGPGIHARGFREVLDIIKEATQWGG